MKQKKCQKLPLFALGALFLLMDICTTSAYAANAKAPAAQLCRWRYNKTAAISFTLDDGFSDAATIAAPLFEEYGWRGTFFVVIDQTDTGKPDRGTWAMWKELARRGHEIGSHSWTHRHLTHITDPAIYQHELVESKSVIAQKTGVTPLTYAFAGSKFDKDSKEETLKHYLRARASTPVYGAPNPEEWEYQRAIGWVDAIIKHRSWHVALMHKIGRDKGYKPTPVAGFRKVLDQIKKREDQLWVDTYGNVALYLVTREHTTLKTLRAEESELSFSLTLDATYDQQFPLAYLTVRVPLATEPLTIRAERPLLNHAYSARWKKGFIYIDLPPHEEPVTLSWK
jgi:peptidoglycan/xylan/chitin deacetylase (PgdA/CDA1 family)